MVFQCGEGVHFGKPGQSCWSFFLVDSESDVGHEQLQAAGAIRPSLPLCFSVAMGSVLEAWTVMLELISCEFRKQR